MNGDFLSLLVAMIHVYLEKNPELGAEIRQHADHYRRYIFVDGSDTLDAMKQAFDLLTSTIGKTPYSCSKENYAETK